MSETGIAGLMAEFADPDALVAATRRLHAAGFRRIEAYTPYAVEEVETIVEPSRALLPAIIFCVGTLGLLAGFFMQYWGAALSYPLNIGGRPLNSWPAFVPITFEITVLWAVAGGFFGFFIVNRLPRLRQGIAETANFERASRDRFFLCVEADDPRFEVERVRWLFEHCQALRISEVPR